MVPNTYLKALGEQVFARRVLNIYYDKSFAEMIYREIVLHHSNVPWQQHNMHVRWLVSNLFLLCRPCRCKFSNCFPQVKSIWPRVHLRALEAGNMLGNLYPSHTRHWWPLLEDIYMSYQVQSLKRSILTSLEHSQEFLCLSIDATLKVCMTVQGQANYRPSAQVRNAACFDDEHSLRRVLTIRGRTGAVLGIVPVPSEDSPKIKESLCQLFSNQALLQVRYLATDNPSPKLFRELKEICPNLSCLSLDPVHLAIVYEYAQWGKKTAGSKASRAFAE